MTTIAMNHEMMCSDSLCMDSGARSKVQKIFMVDDVIIGFAGDVSQGLMFVQWYADGGVGDYPFDGNFEAAVLHRNGDIYSYDSGLMPIKMEHSYYAIGSGKFAATAAMMLGCDPVQAVQVACDVDVGSGGDVQQILVSQIPSPPKPKKARKKKNGKAHKKTVRKVSASKRRTHKGR